MEIRMSFEVGSKADLVEARKMFDRLSWSDDVEVVETPPPPPAGEPATLPPPVPPPPQTTLPNVPPPPPPDAPPPVELDDTGRPWDERFHAASKNKIKDGTWRRKRKVSQEDVEKAMPVSAPPAASASGPLPDAASASGPPPPAANGAVTWDTVAAALQARHQKYSQTQVQAALRAAGLEPTGVFGAPEQYAPALAALEAHCPL